MPLRSDSNSIHLDHRRPGSRECLLRRRPWNDLRWFLVFGCLFVHCDIDALFSWVNLSHQLFHCPMSSLVGCLKSVCCRVYLIIQNLISLAFAIILLVFSVKFIEEPCLCYGVLCEIPPWSCVRDDVSSSLLWCTDSSNYCTQRTFDKVPLLKALLSFAVLMLVSNGIFIFISVFFLVCKPRKKVTPHKTLAPIERRISTAAPHNVGNQYEPVSRPSSFLVEPVYYSSSGEIPFEPVLPSAPTQSLWYKFWQILMLNRHFSRFASHSE